MSEPLKPRAEGAVRIGKCEKGYPFAGDELWRYMYCSCLSLAVKFMAHIKAPHLQLTDSIYSPGQQIMTPAALRNCNRDPCESPRLYVGRYVDLKVLTLA